MKVSAVLITREPAWPAEAYPRLPSFTEFDEVLVETNCPGIHRRFELAAAARNDVVYVQDDDVDVDVVDLLVHYDGRLTNVMDERQIPIYAESGATLIGWGALFPKRLIDFSRWRACFGDEPIPSREYDRVFTYLAQPHNTIVRPIRMLRRSVAMSSDGLHYQSRDRIFEKLRQLRDFEARR